MLSITINRAEHVCAIILHVLLNIIACNVQCAMCNIESNIQIRSVERILLQSYDCDKHSVFVTNICMVLGHAKKNFEHGAIHWYV